MVFKYLCNLIDSIVYYISYYVYNHNNITFYTIHKNHAMPTSIDDKFIDLCSNVSITIPPKKMCPINLGIKCIIPSNTIGIITPVKKLYSNMIDIKAEHLIPNIDNDIILYIINNSDNPYNIKVKQNIARILCVKYNIPKIEYILN
ncbi:unknown similar to AMEV107 [Choristoneura biennis entomopoxvirus]|uniref:dUTPase-like domain-containing protein n=1 Tax=Choristoneura biennis entomopoxvirus TaxID=10288 RepID=A0A916KPK3_CBEPV|nr:unknown similar to AMEV107 [Choristoneura biennis entomopoxvirus]CCU55728.1 unknown similar to AMEV107 [Choristoneura biennis entomopoxvirus]